LAINGQEYSSDSLQVNDKNEFILHHKSPIQQGLKIRPFLSATKMSIASQIYFEPELFESPTFAIDQIKCLPSIDFVAKLGVLITGHLTNVDPQHYSSIIIEARGNGQLYKS